VSIEERNCELEEAVDDLQKYLEEEIVAKQAALEEQAQLQTRLVKSLKDSEATQEEMQQVACEMGEELQHAHSALKDLQDTRTGLEEQLLNEQRKKVQLEQQFVSLAEQNASTEAKNAKLLGVVEDLENQVAEESEIRKAAQKNSTELQTLVQNANRKLEDAAGEKDNIAAQLERSAQSTAVQMEAKLQEAQSAFDIAKAERAELEVMCVALKQEKAACEKNNVILSGLVNELKQQVAEGVIARQKVLDDNSELTASLQSALDEAKATKQQLEESDEIQAQLQQYMNELKQQVEQSKQVEVSADEQTFLPRDIQHSSLEMKAQLQETRSELATMKKEKATSDSKISIFVGIVDELKKQLSQEIEARKAAILDQSKLQQDLESAIRESEETKVQIDRSANHERAVLENRLTMLENENSSKEVVISQLQQNVNEKVGLLEEMENIKQEMDLASQETQAALRDLQEEREKEKDGLSKSLVSQLSNSFASSSSGSSSFETDSDTSSNDAVPLSPADAKAALSNKIDRLENGIEVTQLTESSKSFEGQFNEQLKNQEMGSEIAYLNDQTTRVEELEEQLALQSKARDAALLDCFDLQGSLKNAVIKQSQLLDEISESKRTIDQLTFDLEQKDDSWRGKIDRLSAQLSAKDGQPMSTSMSAMFATLQSERESAVEARKVTKRADERVRAANERTKLAKHDLGQLQSQVLEIEAERKENTIALARSEAFAASCLRRQDELEKEIDHLRDQHKLELGSLVHDPEQAQSELEEGSNRGNEAKRGAPLRQRSNLGATQEVGHKKMLIRRYSMPAAGQTKVLEDLQTKLELMETRCRMKESTLIRKEAEIVTLRLSLKEKESIIKHIDSGDAFDSAQKSIDLEKKLKEALDRVEKLHGVNFTLERAQRRLTSDSSMLASRTLHPTSRNEAADEASLIPISTTPFRLNKSVSKRNFMPSNQGNDLRTMQELIESQLKMKEAALRRKENDIVALQKTLKEKDSIIKNSHGGSALDHVHKAADLERKLKEAVHKIGVLEAKDDLNGKVELVESQLKMKESTLKRKEDEINRLQDLLKEKESIIKIYLGDAAQDHGQQAAEFERELREAQSKIQTLEESNRESEKKEESMGRATAISSDAGPAKGETSSEYQNASVAGPPEQDLEIDPPYQATTTKTTSTAEESPIVNQEGLAHDLLDEIGMLRMQLSDMMKQTESLASDLEEKTIALQHAEMHLQRLRQDNERLRSTVEAIGNAAEGDQSDADPTEASTESLHEKERSTQQKIAANKLLITSLREELDSEKNHREELEVLVSEKDSDSSARVSDSHSSSPGDKFESISIDEFYDGQPTSSVPIERSKTRDVDLTEEALKQGQTEERVTEKAVADLGRTDEELPHQKFRLDAGTVELRNSIGKEDDIIEMLRAKQREQEALISLLNKTLSEKDTKIARLARLLAEVHDNVNVAKELEENELTIDSLVLIRNEKDTEIKKLKEKIEYLEDMLKEFEETKYQLRNRIEEIAEKKTTIHQLKAELEHESKRAKRMLDDRQEHLDQVRDEKLHLRLDSQDKSQKFEMKLREKEELIKSIHSEATERGLLIDSLDTSLMEANTRLRQLESEIKQQATEKTSLAIRLDQVAQDRSNLIEEHREKDVLIRMLNEARLDGETKIAKLTKPKKKRETNRQKILRRYKKMQAEEGVSGLDTYMEPFVLDLHQAQAEYQNARKNLRLAKARERLIRPRV
ncbi:MAG: hypothetical protein SGBAC_005827, partial [Bacillariaceae sp.]